MTTANEITDGAYRICGVGTPTTTQDTNALTALNEMIALWSTKGLLVPYRTQENFTLTQGTGSYTIGSGGTFDTVRPMVINDAFLRLNSQDYDLDVRLTREEYNEITNKTTQVRPERLLYDTQYPLGIIYFDRVPDAAYTLFLFSRKRLTAFASLSATMDLPDEYAKALRFNLALDLQEETRVTLSQLFINKAVAAHDEISELNSGPVRWAELDPAITYSLRR